MQSTRKVLSSCLLLAWVHQRGSTRQRVRGSPSLHKTALLCTSTVPNLLDSYAGPDSDAAVVVDGAVGVGGAAVGQEEPRGVEGLGPLREGGGRRICLYSPF